MFRSKVMKKLGQAGVLIALASSLVVLLLGNPHPAKAEDIKENRVGSKIDISTAKEAVDSFIHKKEYLHVLQDGEIKLREKLYNQDESLIAYYFTIEGAQEPGYFVVAANSHLDPILQAGYMGTLADTFKAKNPGERSYYLGAQNITFGNSFKDIRLKFEGSKSERLQKLKEKGKTDTPQYNQIKNQELKDLKFRNQKSPGWDNLTKNTSELIVGTIADFLFPTNVAYAASSYKFLDIDHISQWRDGIEGKGSACGPTAGAMIVDFYHDYMNYNVRDNDDYYGTWSDLVNHLRGEMNTSFAGTTLPEWREGMYHHVTHDSGAWSSYQYNGEFNSEKFIAAIDSYDPVGMMWHEYVSDNAEETWHWTVGYGYERNGSYDGDVHVRYQDPSDSTYLINIIDYSQQDGYFYIAYMG